MKRLLLVLVVFGSMLASISMVSPAQAVDVPGLKLASTDCGGAQLATWTCTSNGGAAFTAVASVVINAAGSLTTLVAEESMVEFAFATLVPEWWKLGGTCRASNALAVGYNGGLYSCIDYFGGVSTVLGVNSYQIGPDPAIGDPNGEIDGNRVRMRFVSAVDYDLALLTPPPNVGDEIFLYSLVMNKTKSTGTGSCAGCDAQACMMLKWVKLNQPSGSPGGDPVYNLPASAGSALLSGQTVADCATVPVRSRTWGQIKSLYR